MSYNERLPRKLKKELKKNNEIWEQYEQERRLRKERNKSLDIIFTGDYEDSSKIIRRLLRTGRL